MRWGDAFRQRLGWRLFASYLVVVFVGTAVLAATAEFHMPAALSRHVARMQALVGDDPALVQDLYETYRDAVNEILFVAASAAGGTAIGISLFTTRRIVGPIREMMWASRRIAAGDYRMRVVEIGADELGELARAFNRMAETLEQTEQRRLALIGDVAHELRTPLASIRALIEGVVDGVLPADPATFLEVQREISRLQRLADDLVELSRAETGEIALEFSSVDIRALIARVVGRLRPQFDAKGVMLRMAVPEELPSLQADENRVVQILTNLLGNALQYTPSGGRVTVRAWVEADELRIAVEDTGIGIAPEHLPHIFERFYRVDRSRSRSGGGSGIGLTIARHLVEAHGGRIWAASEGVGRGSTFTMAFPLSGSTASPEPVRD
ncbi:MAG: ATP-binding protein [Anaerolineae bacterium]